MTATWGSKRQENRGVAGGDCCRKMRDPEVLTETEGSQTDRLSHGGHSVLHLHQAFPAGVEVNFQATAGFRHSRKPAVRDRCISGHVEEMTHPLLLCSKISHCGLRRSDFQRNPFDFKAALLQGADLRRIVR